jgi:MarR family transcriptional regulator, organic hydroperoxide resistance regulator
MSAKAKGPHACEAWQLLVRFSLSQRANLPGLAAELELSPAQCHLLNAIEPESGLPMGQLAGALSCDASNVTGLVDRLESRGLVERRPSPADRRVKVLRLTPLGAKLRASLVERMTSPPPTLGRLSQADQQALAKILRRLLE